MSTIDETWRAVMGSPATDEIPPIVKREGAPIDVLYFPGEEGAIRVGESGCVGIEAYNESGQYAYVTWFRARYANGSECRWNGAFIGGVRFAAASDKEHE